jgi:hypothetical protein
METNKKPSNPDLYKPTKGMIEDRVTLRDYFANSAMQSMIGNPQIKRPDESESQFLEFSRRAYRYADAMLKQREL